MDLISLLVCDRHFSNDDPLFVFAECHSRAKCSHSRCFVDCGSSSIGSFSAHSRPNYPRARYRFGVVGSLWRAREPNPGSVHCTDRKVANAVDERGYSRILEYPEYVILGAGEGARYRFGPEHSHELHSSLGTLLFSYGVPGLAFFLLMLLFVLRRKRFSVWLLTMAPLIYSLSHQGLRTTLFWIFLTIVWLYAPETRTAFAPWGSMLREISSTPGYTRARSN